MFLLPLVANAQNGINSKIKMTIENGDAITMAKHFNTSVDLTTPTIDNTLSHNHAKQVLKSFFASYPPTSFAINHDGYSNDGSHYIIGTYKSGKYSFMVYILLRKSPEKYKIYQLQFEKK